MNKSLLAVAMTAGALLSPVVTTTASALPPCCGVDLETTYYSDAAKTTIIGVNYDGGDCQPSYEWGSTSSYYTVHKIYCSTSTP
ncbi:MAG: hypothetical protein JO144_04660 [Actinobacteria bacterium]|nr:hypothetical protein [Actinomycetota bacterium]